MVNNQLDPITAFVAIISLLISPAIAVYVGPYTVIVLAATVGAAWALKRHGVKYNGWQKLGYFLLINGTAILLTVAISNAVGYLLNIGAEYRYLLISPVALFVGGVGNDWPKLMKWAATFLVKLFERRIGGKDASK